MLLGASQSGEAAKTLLEQLREENGHPMIVEHDVSPQMDPDAIEKLKNLSERMNGG